MKPARLFLLRLLAGCVLLLAGCAGPSARPPGPVPPLLLISMDAFRWDYCSLHPAETPHLRALIAGGISARGLVSVFPSNTFPNHYSIVTGLYPSHHGIINNEFFDPVQGELFHYNMASSVGQSAWWGGEPIWITAVRQGRKSASSFWVGSEAEIKGLRPTFWKPYDPKLTFEARFAELMDWLHLPAEQRPAVITMYLEETNSIGHKYGPDSPELSAAIKLQDDRIGAIMDRLKAENLAVNVVIVSDHGMTPISLQRIIILDDFLDPKKVQTDFDGPVAGLRPLDGNVDAVLHALAPLQHARAYRVEDLPARFHITTNPRNPPVWIVPEEGWEIYFRTKYDTYKNTFNKGDHGYDPAFTSMRGILIASGPSFKAGGTVIDEVENIHVYNLLCAALGLKPAPNDGDDRLVRAMLRDR
ncbi:MAG TPA: alkaline phosphatase family protein [Opitutaceae bacterium]|nr:alkaline phosphatase family protein [Opitutaceae bacterium]